MMNSELGSDNNLTSLSVTYLCKSVFFNYSKRNKTKSFICILERYSQGQKKKKDKFLIHLSFCLQAIFCPKESWLYHTIYEHLSQYYGDSFINTHSYCLGRISHNLFLAGGRKSTRARKEHVHVLLHLKTSYRQ